MIAVAPLFMSFGVLAQTAESTEQPAPSKAEKLRMLREAMRGSAGAESDKADKEDADPKKPAKKIKAQREVENQDMWKRALEELKPKASAYSDGYFTSSAVVRTQMIDAKDPIYDHGLQLGLTLQPYAPRGEVPMITLGKSDLSRAGSTWMPGLEFRYAPWVTQILGEHGVGFKVGASYVRQNIAVNGPTGNSLGKTEVHSLDSYAFLSQEWIFRKYKYWSWTADLGASRFDVIQTSENNFADASDNIWLAMLRTGPSYRVGDFWFSLNYERRQKISGGDWARLDADAAIVGVHYGLR